MATPKKPVIKFDLDGEKELAAAVKRVANSVDGSELGLALKAGYFVFEGQAKILIQTSAPTGRNYGSHVASAPGEPPATDTGNLVNAWPEPSVIGTGNKVRVEGGAGAEYAGLLELGTSKMAARPFMRPALDDKENILLAIKNNLKASVRRAT